ncbi:hypothetical protein BCR34DRAFT_575325 [Clohesyomyces aquaticus]|uniref:Uncharacterized protein n=1 Tax=Clohesyomyces aquaticus TaxID=1231657 RepID=A0A1Y1YSM1_9PLEO|nr:hypothetical protein BCR34DRAFT_575325 [Clohesyomyces aquaticus]
MELRSEKLLWLQEWIRATDLRPLSLLRRNESSPRTPWTECCLGNICKPVIHHNKLLLLCATIEVTEANEITSHGRLRNCHNAGVMPRNLRRLREIAEMQEDALSKQFDGKARVITIVFSKNTIEISFGWTEVDEAKGRIHYFTRALRSRRAYRGESEELKNIIKQVMLLIGACRTIRNGSRRI